jgi:hypothetical protein
VGSEESILGPPEESRLGPPEGSEMCSSLTPLTLHRFWLCVIYRSPHSAAERIVLHQKANLVYQSCPSRSSTSRYNATSTTSQFYCPPPRYVVKAATAPLSAGLLTISTAVLPFTSPNIILRFAAVPSSMNMPSTYWTLKCSSYVS